ncbi:hypothetical protein Hypma_008823 [Hypsizygus marmoreus]|uniref:RNase III domain-containing protein n=1 Tax=Hypsizygus marmoreus TaxID=39966 RepID=A0A369JSF2_HYPMA|nr:hypothetical protein Hypma_008823 [Hypsizygus marmoreus]
MTRCELQQSTVLANIAGPAFSVRLPSGSCIALYSRLTPARADRAEYFGDRHLYGYVTQILEPVTPNWEPSFLADTICTMTSNMTLSAMLMKGGFLPPSTTLDMKEQADVFESLVGIAHREHRKRNAVHLMEAWARETFLPLLRALQPGLGIVTASAKRENDTSTSSDTHNPKRQKHAGPSKERSTYDKENIPMSPMVSSRHRPSSSGGSRRSHSSTPQAESSSSNMAEHAPSLNLTQASTQSIQSFKMTSVQGRVIAPLPRTSMTMTKRRTGDPRNTSALELQTDRKSMPSLAPSATTAPRSWKASADSPRSEQVAPRSLSSVLPRPPKRLLEGLEGKVSQDRIIAPLPRSSMMRPRQELNTSLVGSNIPPRSADISGYSAPPATTSSNRKGGPKRDVPRRPRLDQEPSRLHLSVGPPLAPLVPRRSSSSSAESVPASDGPEKTLVALDPPRLRKSYAAPGLFRRSTLGVLSQAANGDRNSRRQ